MQRIIRRLIPGWAQRLLANTMERLRHRSYSRLPVEQVFSRIYAEQEWGRTEGEGFYSGAGSHDPALVDPYINAVSAFLKSQHERSVVVDLGCGDFNVGSHFVEYSREYHACDIVPELQAHNRQRYPQPNLHFPCVNMIDDELPDGDIVFIRQVFQHLSNAQIAKTMDKCRKYATWVVTEHLPSGESFTPNTDISAGCGIRGLVNSGVVLTAPPFNLSGYGARVLCEIAYCGDIIRTTLFTRT